MQVDQEIDENRAKRIEGVMLILIARPGLHKLTHDELRALAEYVLAVEEMALHEGTITERKRIRSGISYRFSRMLNVIDGEI